MSLRGKSWNNRPQTPIPGVDYSSVRNVKLRYDTGAKIVNFLRRGVELKTGQAMDDEELSNLVNLLMAHDVFPL